MWPGVRVCLLWERAVGILQGETWVGEAQAANAGVVMLQDLTERTSGNKGGHLQQQCQHREMQQVRGRRRLRGPCERAWQAHAARAPWPPFPWLQSHAAAATAAPPPVSNHGCHHALPNIVESLVERGFTFSHISVSPQGGQSMCDAPLSSKEICPCHVNGSHDRVSLYAAVISVLVGPMNLHSDVTAALHKVIQASMIALLFAKAGCLEGWPPIAPCSY